MMPEKKSEREKGIGKFLLIVPGCHKTVIRVAEMLGKREKDSLACWLYGEYDYWQGLSVWLGGFVLCEFYGQFYAFM